MKNKSKFLKGLITGMVIMLVINIIIIKVPDFINNYENEKGVQIIKEGYNTPKEKIDDILSYIQREYYIEDDVKLNKLYESAYAGLVSGLNDPWTEYFTKDEYESFMEAIEASFEGIGAVVTLTTDTKEIMILSPFIGSPAHDAGLLPGDIIKKVDGKEIKGLKLDDVVKNMIRGEKGTKVILTVYRKEENVTKEIEITRDVISVPTISSEMLENNIGYIRITGFDEVTYKQFKESLDKLKSENIKGLIIDVRNNPGGLLNIVIEIADELMPEGLIVYTENKHGDRRVAKSDNEHKFTKPLVILTNNNSASASEILAGAIQDSKIGTVVGTTTFGKGLVQVPFELEDGSAVKITIARYFTPNGNFIHKKGIKPDVEIELPDKLKKEITIKKEEDIQLQKAIEVINEKLQK